MIYTEEASFPYPVISSSSSDYKDRSFIFDAKITGDSENYKIDIDIAIGSEFLEELIKDKKIEYILIIKTQDNNFYKLDKDYNVVIKRNEISFRSGSKMQIFLRSVEEINLKDNIDLDEFYTKDKEDIIISKNSIIGFSNIIIYERSEKTSIDLFEKLVDESILSEIKIEIREENIAIIFKDKKYQYNDSSQSKRLNYPYIYMGLQKILMEMIVMDSKNEDYVLEIDENSVAHTGKPVYRKIIRLLQEVDVKQISFEEIDEVISKISPNIIKEYYKGVKEVGINEN